MTCGARPDRYEVTPDINEMRATRNESVLRKLSDRAHGRPAFIIENEYDVQDLVETVLRGAAVDVVREEWTPRRAGSAKRIDLVAPSLAAVIECKIVRDKGHARSIADEFPFA